MRLLKQKSVISLPCYTLFCLHNAKSLISPSPLFPCQCSSNTPTFFLFLEPDDLLSRQFLPLFPFLGSYLQIFKGFLLGTQVFSDHLSYLVTPQHFSDSFYSFLNVLILLFIISIKRV